MVMSEEDADKLKAQVEQMTWGQLVALWRWIMVEIYYRMSQGPIYSNSTRRHL